MYLTSYPTTVSAIHRLDSVAHPIHLSDNPAWPARRPAADAKPSVRRLRFEDWIGWMVHVV